MPTRSAAHDLVKPLHAARRDGREIRVEPAQVTPEEALSIQLAVADRFAAAGAGIGGWKVGLTSGEARDRMGEGFRPFGFILADRIRPTWTTIPFQERPRLGVDAEIGLVLGAPLNGGDVDAESARAAVRGVVAAFEINELRLAGGLQEDDGLLVADGLTNWGMVVGDEIPTADCPTDVTATVTADGAVVATATAGADVAFDDPFLSLSRLCRMLHRHGRSLAPGQLVLAGGLVKAEVPAPGAWTASFLWIGDVAVRFA